MNEGLGQGVRYFMTEAICPMIIRLARSNNIAHLMEYLKGTHDPCWLWLVEWLPMQNVNSIYSSILWTNPSAGAETVLIECLVLAISGLSEEQVHRDKQNWNIRIVRLDPFGYLIHNQKNPFRESPTSIRWLCRGLLTDRAWYEIESLNELLTLKRLEQLTLLSDLIWETYCSLYLCNTFITVESKLTVNPLHIDLHVVNINSPRQVP
ncbi:uncharacterized protein BDR25DRAFT_360151 [Lindgomyces ingoldianus]|uniref:Uncharacterized protein n=1 Tax=Lindgomyces ingoldianus TaxID=673940 RepID=A0ACB6QIN1_9PLEO|nr:uncharacterized protein BDR25DRAFT_360151 [Lindgomyces ingoldianus]KAF2465996.1 hypothetical protein BDR25DRAFT_360151 [Lindgomyces ingoldianus]